jgi:hypothetical protein
MAGCSDLADDEKEHQEGQESVPLRVTSLTRAPGDTDSPAVSEPDPFEGMSILLFLVPADDLAGTETQTGEAIYSGAGNPWYSSLSVKNSANYKVFGFMPASVSKNKSYSVTISGNQAVMTVPQMKTVSDLDVCVITGVKNHPLDASNNEKVLPGIFDYEAEEIEGQGYGVSLLAEHIYSAVGFQFQVVEKYKKLRTIKLKQVILKNAQQFNLTMGSTETPVPNPIGTITMEDVTSTETTDDGAVLFDSSEGVELKTTYSEDINITGYFAPQKATGLEVESVYDVYDNKGVLIRENSHATNKIGSLLGALNRGERKVIKMTVNPTYLYVLSDPDADTPMVVAEETGD